MSTLRLGISNTSTRINYQWRWPSFSTFEYNLRAIKDLVLALIPKNRWYVLCEILGLVQCLQTAVTFLQRISSSKPFRAPARSYMSVYEASIDDSDPQVLYSNGWVPVTQDGDWTGTMHSTSDIGSSARVRFTGA